MRTLHFDTAAFKADYIAALTVCIDKLIMQYYKEVEAGLNSESGRNDLEIKRLDTSEKNRLIRQLVGGAHAVIDSFGTGSKMDTSNPALAGYMKSGLWNPSRFPSAGNAIRGRPEGAYTDIFGEEQYSSGKMAGLDLEIRGFVEPISPSGAFQNAEKWFNASDIAREELDRTTREFIKGVRANSGKYFRFG